MWNIKVYFIWPCEDRSAWLIFPWIPNKFSFKHKNETSALYVSDEKLTAEDKLSESNSHQAKESDQGTRTQCEFNESTTKKNFFVVDSCLRGLSRSCKSFCPKSNLFVCNLLCACRRCHIQHLNQPASLWKNLDPIYKFQRFLLEVHSPWDSQLTMVKVYHQ